MPPAVILAAGESSRFWPLSTHGDKSLHRLCGKAIIEHTVCSLVSAGVTEIIIAQSPASRVTQFPHRTIEDQLGDGTAYGANISYVEQPLPNGPGPTIQLVLDLVKDQFFITNAENINAGDIVSKLWEAKGDAVAAVAAQQKEETWMFGVCALKGDLLSGIVEKPAPGKEPSSLCNMGVYLVGPEYAAIQKAEPEHEHSNIFALAKLCKELPVRVVETTAPFFPLKYPWHLFAMADFLKPDKNAPYIGENVEIAPGAQIDAGSVIENDAVIGDVAVVQNSLIGAGSQVDAPVRDSIFGAAVVIEHGALIREKPLQGGHVHVDVKGHVINTNMERLGVVVGQGSVVETGAEVLSGVLVGAESRVSAAAPVAKNIPDQSDI